MFGIVCVGWVFYISGVICKVGFAHTYSCLQICRCYAYRKIMCQKAFHDKLDLWPVSWNLGHVDMEKVLPKSLI